MGPVAGNDDSSEMLYGLHAVREALRAGTRSFQRILVLGLDRQFSDLVHLARAKRVPVHVEPRPFFDRLVPDGKHQGVVGLVAIKPYADQEDILQHARDRGEPPFVVLLDGVEDPHNLGAVIRTAEAAGVHGIFLPERRSVGLTVTVAKTSAGAVEHMRVGRVPNLARLIEQLQSAGLWVFGLEPEAPKPYTLVDFRGPTAVVLGGEGKGIRHGVLEKCDERISIPLYGQVRSLNVSAAAAVALYEVVRQRAVLSRSKPALSGL
ncbi:MAG: 23S rRNA (guanosine(2251)-2'-O)-methyltransferase RlmB [Nitrospiraceae bacterium]